MRTAGLVVVVAVALSGCSVPTRDADVRPSPGPSASSAGAEELADRAAHTMTRLPGDALLVAGGCDVDGCRRATASTFVLAGQAVSRVGDLGEARDAHTAVSLPDGRVLVTGGFAGEGQAPLRSAEVFDPSSGRWSPTGMLERGRGGHAAALLGDGRVLVAGGWVGPSTYTDTTEIFDPSSGTFAAGPRLPLAVDGLSAASLPDGCALVVGGQVRSGVATGQAVTVCPDGSVDDVGPLGTARFKHGMVALDSGAVLVAGGTPDDAGLLTSTEVFDGATRTFRPGPELTAGRYKLTDSIVALPGDRAVVAGGGAGVDVVDVREGTSTPIGALGGGRRSFSTVGLTDGDLVLVGGYDESIALTRTYERVRVETL